MKNQSFVLLLFLAIAASCQKNPSIDPDPKEEPTVITVSKDPTKFNAAVACWLPSDVSTFKDLFAQANFQVGVTNKDADLIVTDMQNLQTYSAILSQAYDNGCVIIVLNPDLTKLDDVMYENNWIQMIPSEDEDVILYAFCMHGAYALNRIGKTVVFEEDDVINLPLEEDEEKTSDPSDADYSGEDTFVNPYQGIDFSELGYYSYPFSKWVNEHLGLTPQEDPNDYQVSFQHQYTYKCKLFIYEVACSDADYIEGNLPVVARYEIQPYYVYSDQNYTQGDYYMVKVNYSCEMNAPGGVFKGDDCERKHGGIYVHYTGAFLRNFKVKTYVDSKDKNTKMTFIATGTPKPTTEINVINYSKSVEHSVNVGVSGGGGKAQRPGQQPTDPWMGSWDVKASLNYGHKASSTVSYSVKDLSIRNNSSAIGATAAWEFICNNLPKPKGEKSFTCTTPGIARSSTLLDAAWIWHGTSAEWRTYSLGKIVTEFCPTVGICSNGICLKSYNRTYPMKPEKVSSKLVVPVRIPFGTVYFDNRFKGDTLIRNVSATYQGTYGEKKELYKSVGDFTQVNPCKCNLPEGPYSVTLDAIDAAGNVKKFKSKNNIQVGRRRDENDIQHCTVSHAQFVEVK